MTVAAESVPPSVAVLPLSDPVTLRLPPTLVSPVVLRLPVRLTWPEISEIVEFPMLLLVVQMGMKLGVPVPLTGPSAVSGPATAFFATEVSRDAAFEV